MEDISKTQERERTEEAQPSPLRRGVPGRRTTDSTPSRQTEYEKREKGSVPGRPIEPEPEPETVPPSEREPSSGDDN